MSAPTASIGYGEEAFTKRAIEVVGEVVVPRPTLEKQTGFGHLIPLLDLTTYPHSNKWLPCLQLGVKFCEERELHILSLSVVALAKECAPPPEATLCVILR